MPHIAVRDLRKTYRVAERQPGLAGAVRGLVSRRFREIEALAGVDLALEAGELVGMIGPNGAGKSTLIKILCGILVPSSGRCEVGGLVPWRDRIRHVARIGVVFGQRTQLWWDLPVADSFALLRDIYRVPAPQYRATVDALIAMLGIESLLDQPVRQLSLGQRMRCEIAAALLHQPSILFLDEPTIGLDATSKLAVRQFIGTVKRERGVTVILATHDMHDIQALAERVVIIGNGRILRDGPVAAMRAEAAGERRLVVELAGAGDAARGQSDADIAIEGVRLVSRTPGRLELAFDPRVTPAHALIARIVAAYDIRDIAVEEPSIEQLIAAFYAAHGASDA